MPTSSHFGLKAFGTLAAPKKQRIKLNGRIEVNMCSIEALVNMRTKAKCEGSETKGIEKRALKLSGQSSPGTLQSGQQPSKRPDISRRGSSSSSSSIIGFGARS
ncbi:uncharacterized protein PGTG_07152 [Puccinia graminis f. sp. tritici CRL 75-36-700-3]|uniref:Uncharacterized protein n=1 Tax=Puccinia graminis f. sp. tritici (strain CRL 75-36-700-3 / race SCCL) TaxID=418459 RepID=E3K9H5_PUCGT|nr:uncharacterized protein PGTG_07152 [Puccinia graminis f. sp. tritici CRL 75-36-700-3]EFP80900.1 hypothetical protein PGTG_07152 [Puccinia graminis f. sp. tritici CRL 75-36-700-3]